MIKAAWHLGLSAVEILWGNLVTEAYEYMPIAGILRRGENKQGHLQCVGLTQGGWLIFNNGQEARLHPADPSKSLGLGVVVIGFDR